MSDQQQIRKYPCLMPCDGHPGLQPQYVGDGSPIELPEYPGAPDPAIKRALHYHTVEVGSQEEADLLAKAGRS